MKTNRQISKRSNLLTLTLKYRKRKKRKTKKSEKKKKFIEINDTITVMIITRTMKIANNSKSTQYIKKPKQAIVVLKSSESGIYNTNSNKNNNHNKVFNKIDNDMKFSGSSNENFGNNNKKSYKVNSTKKEETST